jgi:hypothetical protein
MVCSLGLAHKRRESFAPSVRNGSALLHLRASFDIDLTTFTTLKLQQILHKKLNGPKTRNTLKLGGAKPQLQSKNELDD